MKHIVVFVVVVFSRYLSSILPIVLQRFSASTTKPETEFDRMVKQRAAWMIEAQKLNTPSTFVEYAKLQRRIDKLSNQIDSYKKDHNVEIAVSAPSFVNTKAVSTAINVAMMACLISVYYSETFGELPGRMMLPSFFKRSNSTSSIGVLSWAIICNRVAAALHNLFLLI